jgi:hypothetical protein
MKSIFLDDPAVTIFEEWGNGGMGGGERKW